MFEIFRRKKQIRIGSGIRFRYSEAVIFSQRGSYPKLLGVFNISPGYYGVWKYFSKRPSRIAKAAPKIQNGFGSFYIRRYPPLDF